MRFALPILPAEFELPDEWWAASGMAGFRPAALAFASGDPNALLVSLAQIEPPFRSPGHPKDWRGFDRARMIGVLTAIARRQSLPPVPLLALPPLQDISPAPFLYRVLDGYHRFYAAVAAGFEKIPATIRECCS